MRNYYSIFYHPNALGLYSFDNICQGATYILVAQERNVLEAIFILFTTILINDIEEMYILIKYIREMVR